MVEVIRRYGLEDKAILRAMRAIPRHEFVQKRHETLSYADRPLDIGYGQTISQPYIVAAMTHLLDVQPGDKVLEIGTGSGYQASVLTHLTTRVYTIEIIKELAESAKERCVRLGYDVIEFREGDGYYGWPSEAPFEGIIVTAAAGQIPPPLVEQLAKSGRMVIPVGPAYATQWLMLLEKDEEGRVRSRSVMPVRFVPLVRETK
jgi:protein-L-isoaspartate(D-aspartate) O-methyltransferase